MNFKNEHFQEALLPFLGKTNKLLHFFMNERLKEKGIDLTKQQVILLYIISNNDGEIQNELAFFTNRDKTSLTRLINSLEKKALVARIPSKEDKRKNRIFMTKSGHAMVEKIIPVMRNNMAELEEGISTEEKEFVKKVLLKMRDNIRKYSNVAIPTNLD